MVNIKLPGGLVKVEFSWETASIQFIFLAGIGLLGIGAIVVFRKLRNMETKLSRIDSKVDNLKQMDS